MLNQFTSSKLKDLNDTLPDFERKLIKLAGQLTLDPLLLPCDHIAICCNSEADAQRWRQGLLEQATLLSENWINERPVCLFDLNTPLQLAGLSVDCVELLYPRQKAYRQTGWEHLEFVLSGDPQSLVKRVLPMLPDELLIARGYSVKISSPEGKNETLNNTTVALSDGDITVKFHAHSIRDIIASTI